MAFQSVCDECKAVVVDREAHAAWHATAVQIVPQPVEPEPETEEAP